MKKSNLIIEYLDEQGNPYTPKPEVPKVYIPPPKVEKPIDPRPQIWVFKGILDAHRRWNRSYPLVDVSFTHPRDSDFSRAPNYR